MGITSANVAVFVIAISFAAGLNVYATLLTLGVLTRLHWVTLPPGLDAVANWWVVGASVVLFLSEFFADKVPGFDLVWNAAHTFVRIPLAALLAYGAATHLAPEQQALVTILGGAIAMVVHGSKLATRGTVTASPEPFSNIALSTGEDVAAVAMTWTATHHPYVAASVAIGAIIAFFLLARTLLRAMGRLVLRATARPAVQAESLKQASSNANSLPQ